MGTSNFHNVNASRVFALEAEDEWEWDDNMYNVKEALLSRGFCIDSDFNDPYELRRYPSHCMGDKQVSREFMGVELFVRIVAVMRSGYYEGACLDWVMCVGGYTDWWHDEDPADSTIIECVEWDTKYESCNNAGLIKANIPHLRRWFDKVRNELIAECEAVFEEVSTPLRVVARFSNGETMYEKAN